MLVNLEDDEVFDVEAAAAEVEELHRPN